MVDDFAVKYINREDVNHLINTIRKYYPMTVDKEATKYIGLTIQWDYINRKVHTHMPGYLDKAYVRLNHEKPMKIQTSPHHLSRQSSFRFPIGRHGQPGSERMTARAGIHVSQVSRMYGWTIGHKATNCNLPFSQHHSTPTLPPRQPRPSRRSHVVPPLGKDNCPDVGMATPGASLRCSSQEIQVLQETEEENG